MTLPAPPAPPYRPTTDLVSRAWLRLAVPWVRVDDKLPKADAELRTVGFIRPITTGGGADLYVPLHRPVVTAECWVAPPAEGVQPVSWNAAGRLAQAVIDATYDPALMGRVVDLTQFGAYAPARVHTVIANEVPRRVPDDPGNFARYEVDLQFAWTAA